MRLGLGLGLTTRPFSGAPVVVPPVDPVVPAITIDPVLSRSGTSYSGTARRAGSTAAGYTAAVSLAASTAYPPSATASDFGGTFPSVSAVFAPGSATAPFTFAAIPASVQPE